MSQPRDLVTLSAATAQLAASLPADVSALPAMISAASSAVQRYCARDFVLLSYDELYDGNGYASMALRQYPLAGPLTRLATTPTTALTVANADAATNQRASAWLAATGDALNGWAVTGLTLSRTASGVTTQSPLLFSTYVTVAALAAAVNALGNGWSATAAAGYGLWGTAELRSIQGASDALGPGAAFQVHAQNLAGFTVNDRSAVVTLGAVGAAASGWFGSTSAGYGDVFPVGVQNVRAAYAAGYAAVPGDVQQAVLVAVQDWLLRTQRHMLLKSEKAKDYEYENWETRYGLPPESLSILKSGGWRSFRRV